MSPRDWHSRIRDILDAAREIQAFTSDLSFDTFNKDIKTIRAIELNFIVIGEAVNGIPDEIQGAYPEVPWGLMRSMRNRLVHAYFEVDPKLVWETIQNDIPPLIASLEKIIG